MVTISVCMIVKNEEKYLQRCLESVKYFADEIIIVDTGSLDTTKDIARQFTDKIFDFQWVHDFSLARNFALSHAKMEWIFVIDADEFIAMNPKELLHKSKFGQDVLAFSFIQRNYTNTTTIPSFKLIKEDAEHIPLDVQQMFKGYSERPFIKLFKNVSFLRYKYFVHEQLDGFSDVKKQVAFTSQVVHHLGFDAGLSEEKKRYYLSLCEKQAALYPKDEIVLFNLAMAYADNKQMDKAVVVLYTIYSINRNFHNLVRVLSDFLVKLGRIDESQQLLQRQIEYLVSQEERDNKELSYLYYLLGLLYFVQKKFSEAQQNYQLSNQYFENADAYNGLALLLLFAKEYRTAHDILLKAEKLNPYNPNVITNLEKVKGLLGILPEKHNL